MYIMKYVSRAGEKLEYAIQTFNISIKDCVCADFGSNTGGFVDCLLSFGAKKVYAIETGYGVLDWKLRNNDRVIVMERTNAMHIALPEKMDLITIDTSWTKLEKIIPNALENSKPSGKIISLLKPHYEAEEKMIQKGKLLEEHVPEILEKVKSKIKEFGLKITAESESPILGEKRKNREWLFLLER